MAEQTMVEALVDHLGVCTMLNLVQRVCDAKAAFYAAHGDMAQAKRFARHAERLQWYRDEQ